MTCDARNGNHRLILIDPGFWMRAAAASGVPDSIAVVSMLTAVSGTPNNSEDEKPPGCGGTASRASASRTDVAMHAYCPVRRVTAGADRLRSQGVNASGLSIELHRSGGVAVERLSERE